MSRDDVTERRAEHPEVVLHAMFSIVKSKGRYFPEQYSVHPQMFLFSNPTLVTPIARNCCCASTLSGALGYLRPTHEGCVVKLMG